ncbi:MAG: arsenite methyltransferase [Dehalococcoidia bacterium]|nr:arsenite methyltransferase [Dehalococcoidia bacterium]
MDEDTIRKVVREGYANIARQGNSCCSGPQSCCAAGDCQGEVVSGLVGYSAEELESVPEGADLGLGCGNPVALASLREGEVVLDLGSGAGLDCFLAAGKVGRRGRVIGVDMTPEMVSRARENARKVGCDNVEFRLGEIENLPVADSSADVVISNCVINLSPDKSRVFREAYRVLKPGGRLMVSDIVLLKELPDFIKESVTAYVGCVSGAMLRDDYLAAIEAAGLQDVTVIDETTFPVSLMENDPTANAVLESSDFKAEKIAELAGTVVSIKVQASKPAG